MADILSGLKNKIAYNVHKATYDPEAEKFAKEKAEQDKKEKEEAQKRKEDEIKKEKATEAAQTPGQKAARIGKSIASKTLQYVTLSMGIFLAIVYAMLVANNLITEPITIRVFAFIATLLLSIFNPIVFGFLTIYFLSTGIYNKSKGKTFFPSIFAMLPITTTPRTGTVGSIFNYPFFYPKGEESQKKLKEIIEKYKSDLKGSFIDFEGLSASYPVIKKAYDTFSKNLDDMNTLKAVVEEAKNNIVSAAQPNAPASKDNGIVNSVNPVTQNGSQPPKPANQNRGQPAISANAPTETVKPVNQQGLQPASGPVTNSAVINALATVNRVNQNMPRPASGPVTNSAVINALATAAPASQN